MQHRGLLGTRRGEPRGPCGTWVLHGGAFAGTDVGAGCPSCAGSWQMGPGVVPHLCPHGGPQGLLFFQNQEIEELTKICDELIAKLGKAD